MLAQAEADWKEVAECSSQLQKLKELANTLDVGEEITDHLERLVYWGDLHNLASEAWPRLTRQIARWLTCDVVEWPCHYAHVTGVRSNMCLLCVATQRALHPQVVKSRANGGIRANAALLGKLMSKLLGAKYSQESHVLELRAIIIGLASADLGAALSLFNKTYASTFHLEPLQLSTALEKAQASQACAEWLMSLHSLD